MITRILLYIKHNLKFVWKVVEWVNGAIFKILFGKRFKKVSGKVISEHTFNGLEFRVLGFEEMKALHSFIQSQPEEDMKYFRPHEFDLRSLQGVSKNPAFIMMGAFDGASLAGYFSLRCFINKKCFVGRLVDRNHQGRGIGKVMNNIMYNIAWETGFRCLSTISRKNRAVMAAHSKNNTMVVLKELDYDYMLVEFKEPRGARGTGLRAQSIEHGARSKALGNQ
jgi:hypothetical protein